MSSVDTACETENGSAPGAVRHPLPLRRLASRPIAKTRPLTTGPHRHVRQTVVIAADSCAATLAAVNYAFATHTVDLPSAIATAAGWVLTATICGRYRRKQLAASHLDIGGLLTVAIVIAGIGTLAISGGHLHGAWAGACAVVAASVAATRVLLTPLTRANQALRAAPVVVVGESDALRDYLRQPPPVRIAAICCVDAPAYDLEYPNCPLSDVVALAQAARADAVVVIGTIATPDLRDLAWRLSDANLELVVCPLWMLHPHRIQLTTTADSAALLVTPARRTSIGRRTVDVVLGLVGLLVAAPIFAAAAAAIWLDDRGPVFFRQERTGLGGRRFKMWKFRTMVRNADARKRELLAGNQYREGTLFKMADDPRVTRVGKWLRRTSLDELPQLFNVIGGDMTLVGPRPTSTPPENMPPDYRRRTMVKPGLTGLWQVSGRSRLSWADSVRLDLHYVDNRSAGMDVAILARTIPAVLKRDGAY